MTTDENPAGRRRRRRSDAVRRQARDDAEANELEFVRPAGELAHTAPTPLSVTDVLNKVPPFQVGHQIVAEAQRLAGVTSAAIYLCDLDGTTLQRMAGGGGFPRQLAVPVAVGPEIPREGIAALRDSIEEVLPDSVVAPAIALADEYTDVVADVRRVRATTPAAEIQQNLLPPRILRIGGALIAGNVLPGYDIGGDWFDYAENEDCAWIGIADTDGEGARAAGLGAIILVQQHRLADGDRLLLLSDAIIDRPLIGGGTLGLDGVRDAVIKAPLASAAGMLRAVEDAVRAATEDPLDDDATLVVLVPNPAVSELDNDA